MTLFYSEKVQSFTHPDDVSSLSDFLPPVTKDFWYYLYFTQSIKYGEYALHTNHKHDESEIESKSYNNFSELSVKDKHDLMVGVELINYAESEYCSHISDELINSSMN